jgi:hypothetical protein
VVLGSGCVLATFLGTLLHGPEISRLTLNLVPESDVHTTCGAQALACYDPQRQAIYASPEDHLDAPPAKEIVTHEHGHHLANNSDAPWQAIDYGTKGVVVRKHLRQAADGEASPGDEGAHASRTREAFAGPTVLNLRRRGPNESAGTSSINAFPDATALTLLQQDITTPRKAPGFPTEDRSGTARCGGSA